MGRPSPRWKFLGISTNDHGVTFASLCDLEAANDDRDFRDLLDVLQGRFGAVETGRLNGPYSMHVDLVVGGLGVVVVVDDPDSLDLAVRDGRDGPALEALVGQVIEVLNGDSGTSPGT